jgi:hypothetical protein
VAGDGATAADHVERSTAVIAQSAQVTEQDGISTLIDQVDELGAKSLGPRQVWRVCSVAPQ